MQGFPRVESWRGVAHRTRNRDGHRRTAQAKLADFDPVVSRKWIQIPALLRGEDVSRTQRSYIAAAADLQQVAAKLIRNYLKEWSRRADLNR
jgi:hypothetical protein